MKTALTTLMSLALAFLSSACNFSSLTDPPGASKAEARSRQQGRANEGAFRPIRNAPSHRSGS